MPQQPQPELLIRRLSDRGAMPEYQTALAAGMDLCACLARDEATAVIEPVWRGGSSVMVPTGLALEIPEGFEGQVRPRSGLAAKHGVTVANAPGTIDADYRGELRVLLVNLGPEPFVVTHGMRIAQLVIAPVTRVRVVEAEALSETVRGGGGFGSTGV